MVSVHSTTPLKLHRFTNHRSCAPKHLYRRALTRWCLIPRQCKHINSKVRSIGIIQLWFRATELAATPLPPREFLALQQYLNPLRNSPNRDINWCPLEKRRMAWASVLVTNIKDPSNCTSTVPPTTTIEVQFLAQTSISYKNLLKSSKLKIKLQFHPSCKVSNT